MAQFAVSCYETSKKVRQTNMLQSQKTEAATGLPEVPPMLWNKMWIHWFMMFQDSVLMQLSLNVKLAYHVKRSTNVERNNVSYSIRHRSYYLHFKTVVVKYAEQTNNCETARICSISWVKHPKVERTKTRHYANSVQKLSFLQIQRQSRMSVSCNIITQWEVHPPMGLITCVKLRDGWLNVSWCGVQIHSESLSIQVNVIVHALWESGLCYINYFNDNTALLEKILILVFIFKMFPISYLKLKRSFSHMPTIFTLQSPFSI
jgi:hypothetical protein